METLMNTFCKKFILDAMLLCKVFWIIITHESCARVLWLKWNYACWRKIFDGGKRLDSSSFVRFRENDGNQE